MLTSTKADHLRYAIKASSEELAQSLIDTNARTRSLLQALTPEQLRVPQLPLLNPPHWEFGHVNWFHDYWIHRLGQASRPSLLGGVDAVFNSSLIANQSRWTAPVPPLEVLLAQNEQLMQKTLAQLDALPAQPHSESDRAFSYFVQLAILHQDMHNEAFAMMWHYLGYPEPFSPFVVSPPRVDSQTSMTPTYLEFVTNTITLGSNSEEGFLFDNEKWAHPVTVPAFAIASHAVTNAQYLKFVNAVNDSTVIPQHWRCEAGTWSVRDFDRWQMMAENAPVSHINYADAQRYCAWKGERLPTEAELSVLMVQNEQAWQVSDLWEWTSSSFAPFAGFSPDPYEDYSQPWFDGSYRVLKGWSRFTTPRMRRPAMRNFYQTQRADPFCGFRTCLVNPN